MVGFPVLAQIQHVYFNVAKATNGGADFFQAERPILLAKASQSKHRIFLPG